MKDILVLVESAKKLTTTYLDNHPILALSLLQIARVLGFLIGLVGGYNTVVNPAPALGKYEEAYHIAGAILLSSSSVALVAVLLIFLTLILAGLKV